MGEAARSVLVVVCVSASSATVCSCLRVCYRPGSLKPGDGIARFVLD
jgi:hypothetical protein